MSCHLTAAGARLATPAWFPGHDTFNIGDVAVVALVAVLIYRYCARPVHASAPDAAPKDRVSGSRRYLAFDAAITAGGLAVGALSVWQWVAAGAPLGMDQLVAVALVVVTSRFPFVLPHRAGDVVIGFEASAAVFLALIDHPWSALALWSVSTALAQGSARKRWRTRLFNVGLTTLGGGCLIGTVAVGRMTHLSDPGLLGVVMVGCSSYFLLDLATTAASLALEAGSKLTEALRWRAVPIALLCFVAVDTLGYLAALLRQREPQWALLLLLVPVVTILVAIGSVSRSRLAEQRLTGLFEAACEAPEWADETAAEPAVLTQVRRVLRHTVAELRTTPPHTPEIGAPFQVDGRPLRYLIARRTGEADPFDKDDQRALEAITAVAVTSINRRRLAEEMFRLARHDTLTGLANRAVFADRLDEALRTGRAGTAAVLYCDLDGFKAINDRLGHDAGDRLLMAVAGRIQAAMRPEDIAARLGGDEFAVLLRDARPGTAEQVAGRLLEAFRDAFLVDGAAAQLSASIGIAYATSERRGVELLSKADTAMYRAKARGKDRIELFHPEMRAEDLRRLQLEDALRQAVSEGLVTIALQPIIELGTGRVAGFEALARWTHPELGDVPPDVFVPAAERLGLMPVLGRQVLEQAHYNARLIREHTGRSFSIWVNLAPSQVLDSQLADRVAQLVHEQPDIPLLLELTERSVISDDQRTSRALTRLSEAGAKLVVDDFGVGYSSIGYLHRFPVEVIKIDKSFMSDLSDQHGLTLVQAIIAMALALDLRVVAEGLETWSACTTAHQLGASLGQGFLFSRPLPPQRALLLAEVGQVDVSALRNVATLPAARQSPEHTPLERSPSRAARRS